MAMVCGPGDGGCLSRCFDKIFEDAQLSGVLQLNGRNLKSLPPHAHHYDLSDTVTADMSRNRLLDFPVELKQCGFLETLQLQKNCIRTVPNFVASLTSLTFLDLSFNQIQQLPVALFTLPLEILLIKGSRLETIPNEIDQLAATLDELDVSCNKLITLPSQIGALSKLRVFNARHNLLTWLPYEFCQLRLRHCDVSFNRIAHIEIDFRLMTTLVEFNLEGNPMQFPSAKICARGRDHIFQALESQLQQSRKRKTGANGQRLSAGDLEQRFLRCRPSLLPTNPSDIKYLASNRQSDGAKTRNRTFGGDSGYSTLNDENVKIEFETYRSKLLPPAGASFFNDTANRETVGGLVDEVMLACMEKVAICSGDQIDSVSFPAPLPNPCETQKTTPRSVKSELIQALYTGGSTKAKDVSTSPRTIRGDKINGKVNPIDYNGAEEFVDECSVVGSGEEKKTSRRLFYNKGPQNQTSIAATSAKAQKLQRRSSLKNGTCPPDGREKMSAESICSMLESKLRLNLPRCDQSLAELLSDGILLCEYLNVLRPRTVTVVHRPTENMTKIPAAKARRNLENFLTGCRRLGVPEEVLPSYDFILHQCVELKVLNRLLESLAIITAVHEVNAPSSMLTLRQHLMAYGLIILLISYLFRLLNIYC